MGHAGALISAHIGTIETKTTALRKAGAEVSPSIKSLIEAVSRTLVPA
jgi:succinyl-CoA synthetase alpha subunit